MAEEKARLPREPEPGFVGRLVPDPASPPELAMLVGYPGASPEKGSIRLYASPDLSRWWEIPEEDVLHRRAVPDDPLGAEFLWIRRDKQPVLNPRRSDSDMNTFTQFFGCPTIGCTGGAAAVPPAQPAQNWSTLCTLKCEVGAGPVNTQQIPHTQGCTYGGVAPTLSWQHCFGPPSLGCTLNCTVLPHTTNCAYGAQGQEMYTWVPPQTQDVNCGTSPVAGALTTTIPSRNIHCNPPTTAAGGQQLFTSPPATTHLQFCTTSPVGAGPQQAQVLPTFGPTQSVPPATFCCPR